MSRKAIAIYTALAVLYIVAFVAYELRSPGWRDRLPLPERRLVEFCNPGVRVLDSEMLWSNRKFRVTAVGADGVTRKFYVRVNEIFADDGPDLRAGPDDVWVPRR